VTPNLTVVDKRPSFGQSDNPAPEPECGKKDTPCPTVNARPLGSKVLLWRIPEVEGAVVTPDAFKDKPVRCKVVAVSDSLRFPSPNPTSISVGDEVLIRSFSGTEVKVDGHDLTVVLVDDILLRL